MAKEIQYNYPVRESAWLLAVRILVVQLIVGLTSLLLNFLISLYVDSTTSIVSPLVAHGFASIFLQTLDAAMLIILVLQWANLVYTITPNEIVIKRGILSLRRSQYKTEKIESVNVYQSFLGKLLNYGTIKFYNPVLKEDVYLINIPDPNLYSEVIRRSEGKEYIQFLPNRSSNITS